MTNETDYAELLQGDILSLLRAEPYWGNTSLSFGREFSTSIRATAGININPNGSVTVYYNPDLYFKYKQPQRHAINKHEYHHPILLHFQRRDAIFNGTCIFPVFDKEIKKAVADIVASGHMDCLYRVFNYAADMAINTVIPNIPENSVFPKNYGFPDGLPLEHYFALLMKKLLKEKSKCNGKGSKNKQSAKDGKGSGKGTGQGDKQSEQQGDGQGQDSDQDNCNGKASGKGKGKGKKGSNPSQQQGSGAQGHGDEEGTEGSDSDDCGCPVCGANLPGELIGDHSNWNGEKGNLTDAAKQAAEAYVTAAVKQAHGRGTLPGHLKAELSDIIEPKMNIKSILENFYASCVSSKVRRTWTKISRRAPYCLRGKVREFSIHLIVAVDTSGSVSDEFLKLFAGILLAFVKAGAKITVIECDAKVHSVYEFTDKIKPAFKGRMGTAFTPVFQHIREKRLQADGIIYLTDGDGDNPSPFIGPKTLWLVTPNGRQPATWGKTVMMPESVMAA